MSPEPWEIVDWQESTVEPAWKNLALAAGWVPPEEAEALREEVRRLRCGHVDEGCNWPDIPCAFFDEREQLARDLRFLKSSWVPPERVETIDLRNPDLFEKAVSAAIEAYWYVPPPRTEGRTLGEAIGAAVLTTWQIVIDECGGGSGKLQIVRAE